MINITMHQQKFNLHLEVQIITQHCVGPLGLKLITPRHLQVQHQIKGYPRNNMVKITSSPLQKYSIYPREGTEPHINKSHYKVSDYFYTKRSHIERDIQFYKDMEEFSNKK